LTALFPGSLSRYLKGLTNQAELAFIPTACNWTKDGWELAIDG
jgi:hypothetical protein